MNKLYLYLSYIQHYYLKLASYPGSSPAGEEPGYEAAHLLSREYNYCVNSSLHTQSGGGHVQQLYT